MLKAGIHVCAAEKLDSMSHSLLKTLKAILYSKKGLNNRKKETQEHNTDRLLRLLHEHVR